MGMKKISVLKDIPIAQTNSSLPIPEVPKEVVKGLQDAKEGKISKVPEKYIEKPGDEKILFRPKSISDYQKPWLPEEIKRNDTRAILGDVLHSPFLAQLTIAKSEKESFELLEKTFKKALELYEAAK